jgi:trans-2,3-dihydro-3-hydroxyanthranilate isomerase
MANIKFYIVDVFAPKKYAGNQLAIFFDLKQQLSSDQMLAITREINFAESTFITALEVDGSFGVRIFTTEYEVPFAGHPTLGTAYIIAKKLLDTPSNEVTLRLKKGDIPVHISKPDNLEASRFTMQQAQPDFGATFDTELISAALGFSVNEFDTSMPIEVVDTGLPYLIVFLKDLTIIKKIKLKSEKVEQFLRSQKLHKDNSPTGLTTSLFFVTKETEHKQHQYHARMFVLEGDRIWEDAATGSANGCLLAYLLKNVNSAVTAIVEQGFEMGRESLLYLDGGLNKNEYILKVGGQVIPISEGIWSI